MSHFYSSLYSTAHSNMQSNKGSELFFKSNFSKLWYFVIHDQFSSTSLVSKTHLKWAEIAGRRCGYLVVIKSAILPSLITQEIMRPFFSNLLISSEQTPIERAALIDCNLPPAKVNSGYRIWAIMVRNASKEQWRQSKSNGGKCKMT